MNPAPTSSYFAGGIIPDDDVKKLKKFGIKEVFGPVSPIAPYRRVCEEERKGRVGIFSVIRWA